MSTLQQFRDHMRIRLDDVQTPYLVSDATYTTYINEAVIEVCMRSDLLWKSVPNAFTLTEGVNTLDLTTLTDDFYRLDAVKLYEKNLIQIEWKELELYPGITVEGQPVYYLVDHVANELHIYPVPRAEDEGAVLEIRGFYLPAAIQAADQLPISHEYEHGLEHWVKYRVYDMPSADLYEPEMAVRELTLFDRVFGVRPNAATEQAMNRPEQFKVAGRW